MIRERRLDSELIMSLNSLPLASGQLVAAHDLAGALDGRQRRAHLMRGPVNGLLVAGALGFGALQLPPHEEVLIRGRADGAQPRRGHRREYGNTMPWWNRNTGR